MGEKKQVTSLRMSPAKRERLDAWIAAQPVAPKPTNVILQALDEFLDRNGAPPEREEKRQSSEGRDGK